MKKRVLVTRPLAQNQGLVQALRDAGLEAVEFPLLAINPFSPECCEQPEKSAQTAAILNKVQRFADYDYVIFISTNAVKTWAQWLDAYWPDLPLGQHFLAIGKATQAELVRHFPLKKVELSSTKSMNSESLLALDALSCGEVKSKKVLVVRGVGGRETLKQTLEQRGATVDYAEVYQRDTVEHPKQALQVLLNQGLDVLTASSGETLDNLEEQAIMSSNLAVIKALPIVVPGERVFNLAKEKGFLTPVKADNAGVEAMLMAINQIINKTEV